MTSALHKHVLCIPDYPQIRLWWQNCLTVWSFVFLKRESKKSLISSESRECQTASSQSPVCLFAKILLGVSQLKTVKWPTISEILALNSLNVCSTLNNTSRTKNSRMGFSTEKSRMFSWCIKREAVKLSKSDRTVNSAYIYNIRLYG